MRMASVNGVRYAAAVAALVVVAGCSAPPADPAPTATTTPAASSAAATAPASPANPTSSATATTRAASSSPAATPTQPQPGQASSSATATAGLTAARVIDGDTIVTSAGDTVRLAGIDTPERGQCGYNEATANLRRTLAGNTLTLTKAGLTDRDRYGRLIRYVDVGEQDAGMDQIMGGFARARYDSRDGYGRHPRQDDYVAADAATPSICSASSTTPGAESTAAAKTAAAPAASATATREATEPPGTGKTTPYANCTEVREAGAAPLHRGDPGYSTRLDRDGDGTACE